MTPNIVFKLIEAWQNLGSATASSDLDKRKSSFANDIRWFEGYADGQEAPKGIVAADWNDDDYYDKTTGARVDYPEKLQSRLCRIFEKLGVSIEWSDMVSSCDDCNKCVQTEPTGYSWQPDFILTDSSIVCGECAKDNAETLLEEAEDGTWNMPSIDPGEYGYVALPEEYQSGWCPGQNDSPEKVLATLKQQGITRVLFVVGDVGQFDSKWRAYVHESELEDEEDMEKYFE